MRIYVNKIMKRLIIILLVTSVFACRKDITQPVIETDFLSTTRTIKTGLVDYGHHTVNADYKEFIANNYDYIVTGEQNLDFNYYKNINANIQIYAYWNSILLSFDQTPPTSELTYLHNGSINQNDPTQRIGRLFDSDFYYVMNTESAEWKTYSTNQINQILNNGFDGIHLDDVYAHLMHEAHLNSDEPFLIGQPNSYTSFTSPPIWYDAQQSHDNYKSYIDYIHNNATGKVIYNGINDHAENLQPISPSLHPKDYLSVSDGAVQEGFVYNGLWVNNPDDGFFGDEYWKAIVQTLIDSPSDKIGGVVSYGDVNFTKARIFAFASYLIGYKPDKEIPYYYAPNEFTLTYLPEWNLKVGLPIDNFTLINDYQIEGVFKREFENAIILVNPYNITTGDIDLGAEYNKMNIIGNINIEIISGNNKVAIGDNSQLGFEKVSTVNLEPYSAVILMK